MHKLKFVLLTCFLFSATIGKSQSSSAKILNNQPRRIHSPLKSNLAQDHSYEMTVHAFDTAKYLRYFDQHLNDTISESYWFEHHDEVRNMAFVTINYPGAGKLLESIKLLNF